ncbi:uncharacterized protein LOC121806285 [Salvia splendens]|uniref:uncharacterized protein LOC121806285 n=1 Tax=Salvia splendens TaxID=180675 RepID=UPI001C278839|nr:uncharacterized protein LOC121806285 [Salvia splendens]
MTKIVFEVCLDGRKCLPKPLRIVIYLLKLIFPYDIIWKRRISTAKLRKKAMEIAVSKGVESVTFEIDEKNQLVVTGKDIDTVKLTRSLRRNVGFARILSLD